MLLKYILYFIIFVVVLFFIVLKILFPSQVKLGKEYRNYEKNLIVDNLTRTYLIHEPKNLVRDEPVPLLIALHGAFSNARMEANVSGLTEKSDKEGFLVVYPNGSGLFGNYLLSWNAGNCCGYAKERNINDVKFIKNVINDVESTYNIDKNKVFVVGISNGGMLTYKIGCELSDIVKGIGVVAGALNTKSCNPKNNVPVIVFHGTEDKSVLYNGGVPERFGSKRKDTSVNDSISFWVKNNNCSSVPVVKKTANVELKKYLCEKNKADVFLYTIIGGGHEWPGGKKPSFLISKPDQSISSVDVMWDFFIQHSN
ncbi:hypothetical protein COV24_02600 [candidate division WWE3 bacterium CG10_big_fil_rev_8_21_14_0_10_32_10]|uniref:Polyhydroxybutyrate depolymerase n=1 Tax=candidate division WWE3 bacterium CG10_big_fil_rev_8_21_14_0_10_32_10 TaxID=1975090 RepID=A0A2H0RAB6_UNCKA|nr:MAG: hypothetical protein COV24_02600 [candidate division WWE3 bacterium CG10_big_fil_rev_8_21_14_0_10_32_10]